MVQAPGLSLVEVEGGRAPRGNEGSLSSHIWNRRCLGSAPRCTRLSGIVGRHCFAGASITVCSGIFSSLGQTGNFGTRPVRVGHTWRCSIMDAGGVIKCWSSTGITLEHESANNQNKSTKKGSLRLISGLDRPQIVRGTLRKVHCSRRRRRGARPGKVGFWRL